VPPKRGKGCKTGAFLIYFFTYMTDILFDLDNTLYSSRFGLEDNVTVRIIEFTAKLLNVSHEEAAAARLARIKKYGTTMEWLRTEKGFTDGDAYYRYIHPENEAAALKRDPELKAFLQSLDCRLSVLSNSPREHVDRILSHLGLLGVFSEIFDLKRLNYISKPRREAFDFTLAALGAKAEETLFIDDIPRNVEAFIKLGGRGILIDEFNSHPDYKNDKIKSLRELRRFL
jgi:putative hydrolase of the HAD superfamily